ncbi:MAG: hypothetical protein R3D44_09705 [Hyphomicrobiaceae bacterium]
MTEQRGKRPGTRGLAAVREFLVAVEANDAAGDAAANAFAVHLAGLDASVLPPAADATWRKIAHLVRAPAEKPFSEKATSAIRSWPKARVGDLVGLVRELNAILEKVENDRLEDEIRDDIRRHYL